MAHAAAVSAGNRNPPVDYAVAVWLGTPEAELAKGLREGWIRAPAGVDVRSWAEQRGLSIGGEPDSGSAPPIAPPAPEDVAPVPVEEDPLPEPKGRIEALLRRFDPAMAAGTFELAWQEAGEDDAARGGRLVSFVARALNLAFDPAADIASQLANVEHAAAAYAGGSRFVRFAAATSRELETLAASDGGVRRALAEHSPWALAGDPSLARTGDVTGRYDRFDRDTGEALLSDAWIADRAKHTAWRHAQAAGRAPDVEGDGWRFVDRAAGDAVTTEIGGAEGVPLHQVIFASDEGDRVTGGAGTDRVHGGRGDDILRGRAGDDLLEGGAGSDVLQGGAGRDVIAGQQGSDEIDGGTGDDELSGGSGDDELTGGRGNDLLRGGAGDDTYRFDDGDGEDTIEDDSGVLVIDDVAVSGTMRRSGDGWASSDGRFRFALEGEGSERSLVVRGSSVDGIEATSGAIRIASWSEGAFGISLQADAIETENAPGGTESPPDQIHAGSEAPLGVSNAIAPPLPDGDAQADATLDAQSASLAAGFSPDWLSTPQHDPWALVDVPALSSALDQWAAPPPVDGSPGPGGALGVTAYDVGDALAATEFQDDDGDGTGNVYFDALATPLTLPLRNDGSRAPPELSLRASP